MNEPIKCRLYRSKTSAMELMWFTGDVDLKHWEPIEIVPHAAAPAEQPRRFRTTIKGFGDSDVAYLEWDGTRMWSVKTSGYREPSLCSLKGAIANCNPMCNYPWIEQPPGTDWSKELPAPTVGAEPSGVNPNPQPHDFGEGLSAGVESAIRTFAIGRHLSKADVRGFVRGILTESERELAKAQDDAENLRQRCDDEERSRKSAYIFESKAMGERDEARADAENMRAAIDLLPDEGWPDDQFVTDACRRCRAAAPPGAGTGELARLREEVEGYRALARATHNGYNAEARKVMHDLKEPANELEALKQLIVEGADMYHDELSAENATLRQQVAELEPALDCQDHTDQRNIGSTLCAEKLLAIALNGRESGVFGGEKEEAAAQAILNLRQQLAEARKPGPWKLPLTSSGWDVIDANGEVLATFNLCQQDAAAFVTRENAKGTAGVSATPTSRYASQEEIARWIAIEKAVTTSPDPKVSSIAEGLRIIVSAAKCGIEVEPLGCRLFAEAQGPRLEAALAMPTNPVASVSATGGANG